MSSLRTPERPAASENPAAEVDLKFKACLEAAVDALIVIDAEGRIEEFNDAATRMFGYEPDDVIGRNVSVLMPPRDARLHDRYMHAYNESREARIIGIGRKVEGRRRDGTVFPVKLSVGEAVTPEGVKYVGVIHDLTEEHASAEALRRSEEALRAAQEIARIGNFDVTLPAGEDQVVSAQVLKVLGLPRSMAGEAAERLFGEAVHPDERDRVAREVDEAASGPGHLDVQYRVVRPSGEVRFVHVKAGVRLTPDGRAHHLVGALHDITESRRAEEEARQARERLTHVARLSTMGEMATGLAHELNQPLTAITAYAQAARRLADRGEHALDGDLSRVLDHIATQALRAGDVIARMRAMVRNRQTAREVVDCNRLVEDLVMLAEPDARAADVALRLDLEERLPPVEVDTVQIQQVLLNLVRNAIDATLEIADPGAGIVIRTRLTSARDIEVSVRDSGCGLPEGDMEKLGTPFFTTKREGTGLGLSISQSIVRAHGGTIRFFNNAEGGATVAFTLPGRAEEG